MPHFVQLLHPGSEHKPEHEYIKQWNKCDHKRKFIKNPGGCLVNGKYKKADLLFWCEWEPESIVIKHVMNKMIEGPEFIYLPFYFQHNDKSGLQRTDPFIFGNCFYYSICRHFNGNRPTQLRNLDKGSIVLFGSNKSGRFVLDTLFVVDDWIEYTVMNVDTVLRDKVPNVYWDVLIQPLINSGKSNCFNGSINNMTFRLYLGATNSNPVDGMYSFFPCIIDEFNTKGFARPVIKLNGLITNNMMQGFKITHFTSMCDLKDVWDSVVLQVTDQKLLIGLNTILPERAG